MKPRAALLIVDAQTAMFESEHAVSGAEHLLDVLANLIERARSEHVPVIFMQHNGAAGGDLEHGSAGWVIHPRMKPGAEDRVIEKSEPDSFQGTTLGDALRSIGVSRIVVAGVLSEYCLDTTVRSAFSRGYRVVLVKDGHSTCDGEDLTAAQIVAHHNRTLTRFAEVVEGDAVAFA